MSIFTFVFALAFFAAQGLAVLATASIATKLLKITHWYGKLIAMSLSYVAWIAFTLTGYALLGGEGGFTDGFGLILMLCFTALLSSAFWAAAWLVAPSMGTAQNG